MDKRADGIFIVLGVDFSFYFPEEYRRGFKYSLTAFPTSENEQLGD